MPELPEVETIKETLQDIVGLTLDDIKILKPEYVRSWQNQPDVYLGRRIAAVSRRGKYLLFDFERGLYMVAHLGMSGRIYLEPRETALEKHVHIVFSLNTGQQLWFQDARRFGGLWLLKDYGEMFATMGVEPLSRRFSTSYLAPLLENRRVAIKTLLLNQRMISGIGNIYADEALYRAGLRPERPAGSLQPAEIRRLVRAIKQVLRSGIEQRGTTLRDFQDGYKQKGEFQDYLKVYGRENEPCPACRQPIVRQVINGRSSHFCPICQK